MVAPTATDDPLGEVASSSRSRRAWRCSKTALRLVALLASATVGACAFDARPVPSHTAPAATAAARTPVRAHDDDAANALLPAPSAALLRAAIDRSADYLVRACAPNGRFVYRINLDPKVTPEPGYNVLRHAGAIYALASYQQRWPSPKVRAAMLRAHAYLRDRHIAPLPSLASLSAVWSRNVAKGLGEAKLGGAGLGLVAISSLEATEGGATDLGQARALAQFLRFMQKPGGAFYSKYHADGQVRSDGWMSLYYPGEAVLGLVLHDRRDPSPTWRRSAALGLAELARSRAGRDSVEPDHWALLASAALMSSPRRRHALADAGTTEDEIVSHAAQICRSMLAAAPRHGVGTPLHGCLGDDGRTTPTATRLEGLLAALTFLPDTRDELRQRIRQAVDAGVAFLLRAQVQSGPYAGALPHALGARRLGAAPTDDGRATEVRIDFVQHAMSAWIAYLELSYPAGG